MGTAIDVVETTIDEFLGETRTGKKEHQLITDFLIESSLTLLLRHYAVVEGEERKFFVVVLKLTSLHLIFSIFQFFQERHFSRQRDFEEPALLILIQKDEDDDYLY